MIGAVVFCPGAPALLPELTGAAAGELDAVRSAMAATLRDALAAVPVDRVVAVCPASPTPVVPLARAAAPEIGTTGRGRAARDTGGRGRSPAWHPSAVPR